MALGKGLSSLISGSNTAQENAKVINVGQDKIEEISVLKIQAGRYQPRKVFDNDELKELANSIRENGVVQPILVRPLRAAAGKYEIIAGERRFRASQIAGLSEVPAIVRELDDDKAFEVAIIENIQRSNLSALEEAEAYKRLTDEFKYTHQQISEKLGRSRSQVTNMLRILELPDTAKHLIEKGAISAGHAKIIVGQHNAEELALKVAEDSLSVRQTEALIKEGKKIKLKGSGKRSTKEILKAISFEFTKLFGVPAKVKQKQGASFEGEFIISYRNKAEFDTIAERLKNINS